jgi:hypothetical protein
MADPEQPISEDAMSKMSVAPPEPEAKPTSGQVAEEKLPIPGWPTRIRCPPIRAERH